MLASIDKTYYPIETDNISFCVVPSYSFWSSLMASFWTNVGGWKYLCLLDKHKLITQKGVQLAYLGPTSDIRKKKVGAESVKDHWS
jgi:hypothetical protein